MTTMKTKKVTKKISKKSTKPKDGWKTIMGFDVYVENDKIMRATKNNGTQSAQVYRYDSKRGGWHNDSGISVSAFRAGIRRGTKTIK